jgi:hypothetical protein
MNNFKKIAKYIINKREDVDDMLGIVIDLDATDAFVDFQDGSTIDVSLTHLPSNIRIGDTVEIEYNLTNRMNNAIDYL